jgi:XapX domain-containing protein
MKVYIISLGAGVLVGVIYSLLNVRSPAPPLVGLAGILLGEQAIPVTKQLLTGASISTAWRQAMCTQHIFGMLPGHHSVQANVAATKVVERQS